MAAPAFDGLDHATRAQAKEWGAKHMARLRLTMPPVARRIDDEFMSGIADV